MSSEETKMSRLSITLGFWSALLSAVAFIVFTLCFAAILMFLPRFSWTNLSDYVVYQNSTNQTFKYLAQFTMIIFGPLFIVLLNSIHEYARGEQKILTRISICFGIIFAVLTGVSYFIQLSVVRLNISKGYLEGLEHLIQTNPASVILAVNVLGWSLFFGLSSLFVAPVFSGGRLEKVIKFSFLANGVFCILGGIGFVLDNVLLVGLSLNLGMGAAVTVLTISLSVLFRRIERTSISHKTSDVNYKPHEVAISKV